jgi:hypothetical protein
MLGSHASNHKFDQILEFDVVILVDTETSVYFYQRKQYHIHKSVTVQ